MSPSSIIPAPTQQFSSTAALRAYQDESERVVSWSQLVIVAIFGGLYAASSKATGAVATFEPVPWALAFYFIFTIVRLGWSYTGSLPVWFVVLSTIVDMSVLFGLIWSFHITYGQPPAFYLKAPTLIYVFIFISIRALRFEVFYVLLAGGIAIAGWSALTFYAAWAHPLVENIVTSNYVEYIYQPKLLWGAEIDKIVAMTVVTGILAIGVARARRLLESEHDATARLRHLAYTDPATNLPNLARLREIITTERDDQPIGIICLDLHGFREQSARFGITFGETLLNHMVQRMRDEITDCKVIARTGQSELCVILEGQESVDRVRSRAEKICTLFYRPFAIEGRSLFQNVVAGVALCPDPSVAEKSFRNAQVAVYSRRTAGDAPVVAYDEAMEAKAAEAETIEADLRVAVGRTDQIVIYYQPIVSVEDASLVGFEALVR